MTITADNLDPKMIATSTGSLLLDIACLWPTNPLPGGAGFFVQARRLARQATPIIQESKYVVNATRNASIEFDKSGGDLKSTSLMFAGTYLLDKGSSFGALKAAERFLPGGASEVMSQNILEGVQLAISLASSAAAEKSSDKIQNRNQAEKKSQSSNVNPYSIDYIGSGSSLVDMLKP